MKHHNSLDMKPEETCATKRSLAQEIGTYSFTVNNYIFNHKTTLITTTDTITVVTFTHHLNKKTCEYFAALIVSCKRLFYRDDFQLVGWWLSDQYGFIRRVLNPHYPFVRPYGAVCFALGQKPRHKIWTMGNGKVLG